MKSIFILHPSDCLTDHLANGDGLVAFGFVKQLALRGHCLHIAARRIALKQPLPGNVRIHFLQTWLKLPILDRLEFMWRARLLFNRLSRDHKFDIVHQMNPVFAGLSLSFVGVKLPIVLGTYVPRWSNDPDAIAAHLPLLRHLVQILKSVILVLQQRSATLLVLTSPAALNRLPQPEKVKRKVRWLQHGIDTEVFRPPPLRNENRTEILFLSNVLRRKGIFTLIEAFSFVLRDLHGCRLTIAGDGPDLKAAVRLAEELGCASSINVLGAVSRDEIPKLLNGHRLLCLPSTSEPYATTIIEAMSCALPVVATNTGGTPYLIAKDGGLLVSPQNPQELADALLKVLSSDSLQAQMGQANYRRIQTSFTWNVVIDQLERIYESIEHKLDT